jgi:nucleotide-binding universal stress UspA family protein
MFEKVVVGVGTDDEAGDDAIALGRQLAAAGGDLILVHVLVVTAKPATDSGSARMATKRRHALEELTDLAKQLPSGVHVSCVEARSVRRGLQDLALAERADLIVVGASRRDEVVRMMLGDDTLEVLEDAPCPVAVAPVGYAARRASTMDRIGVAYNGSPEGDQALELARRLAANQGAELSAFEAVTTPEFARDPWDVREIDHHVEEVRQQVAALGVEAETEAGDPADELLRFARSVDLLVLGSHRYRPIDRLLQSSTPQQLADRTSSPLVVLSASGAERG